MYPKTPHLPNMNTWFLNNIWWLKSCHSRLPQCFDLKDIYSLRFLRRRATVAAMYQSTEATEGTYASTSQRLSHKRIDDLFRNPVFSDKGAKYAKSLFLNLSTLSPFIAGPNSVKKAAPLEQYVNHPPIQAICRVANHIQTAKALFWFLCCR